MHVPEVVAPEGNPPFLGVVDAVEHVEHRALAGAVRPDDGSYFVLPHVERHALQGAHAAERQRHAVDREDHIADAAPGAHAARRAAAGAKVFASRILSSAAKVPVRPSSYFTCAST